MLKKMVKGNGQFYFLNQEYFISNGGS